MRYDSEKNRILISDAELVSIARRGIAATHSDSTDGEKAQKVVKALLGDALTESINYGFTVGDRDFALTASVYNYKLDTATRVAKFELYLPVESPTRPRREETEMLRGRAFVAAEALRLRDGFESASATLHYVSERSGEINTVTEIIEKKKLIAFFNKCTAALLAFGKPEVERVTVRLPSMKDMRFPYPKIRDGQRAFIHAAYRALSRHGKLFAEAPTGTGKTVAALYPALRAIGDGKYDKVFYLTPKSTIAEAAAECLMLFSSHGVGLHAVIITAKERICIGGGLCREDRRLCENSKLTKLPEAALALYNLDKPVIRGEDVREVARAYKVCPYELSLTYAELCDVVICDFNYLFDPSVYIRRFFEKGGRYAFLIDEAHNLSERVRDAYSEEIIQGDISLPQRSDALGAFSEIKEFSKQAEETFVNILMPYLKEDIRDVGNGVLGGAAHLSEIPSKMYSLFQKLEF